MARLIDADAFEKFIKEKYNDNENIDKSQMLFDLSYQPTAYDVEKVVEELEKYRDGTTQSVTGIAAAWAYRGAIDIVRKGGVK